MDPVAASMGGLFLGLAALGNAAVNIAHERKINKANERALAARNREKDSNDSPIIKVRRSGSEEYSKQEFAKYSRERRLSEDSERLKESSKKLKEKNDNLLKSNKHLEERIKELEKQNQAIISIPSSSSQDLSTPTSPLQNYDASQPLISPRVSKLKKLKHESSSASLASSEDSEYSYRSPELKSASPIIKRVKEIFSPKMTRQSNKTKQDIHDKKLTLKSEKKLNESVEENSNISTKEDVINKVFQKLSEEKSIIVSKVDQSDVTLQHNKSAAKAVSTSNTYHEEIKSINTTNSNLSANEESSMTQDPDIEQSDEKNAMQSNNEQDEISSLEEARFDAREVTGEIISQDTQALS